LSGVVDTIDGRSRSTLSLLTESASPSTGRIAIAPPELSSLRPRMREWCCPAISTRRPFYSFSAGIMLVELLVVPVLHALGDST
jgi:hypothetical protein